MRRTVEEVNACALDGVSVKYDSFISYMWHSVEMGYVTTHDAMFVATGLRWGFNLEADLSKLRGKRVFRNYPPTRVHRASVTDAMMKRVAKHKTVLLGECVNGFERCVPFGDFTVFPMGVVDKVLDGVVLDEKRLTSDHTASRLNEVCDLSRLRHEVSSARDLEWFLKCGWWLRVSDVDGAFPQLPLAPPVWPHMLCRAYAHPADTRLSLFCHVCGDFGAAAMPGTFHIFFQKVLIPMARCAQVLTLPMAVHVDDCGLCGAVKEATDAEMIGFQAWTREVTGVEFKPIKDREAAQRQLMIGFWWDSNNLTRTLESHKLVAYVHELTEAACSSNLSLLARQSLAGKMHRAVMTLPPGAACLLANVYAMMRTLTRPWHSRRTSAAERDDYAELAGLLELNLGQGYYSYANFSTAPECRSDACRGGRRDQWYCGGGYVSACGAYRYFEYCKRAARKPIDFLEGDSVYVAVCDLGAGWRECVVPFAIDNTAFQFSLAKWRSQAPRLQAIVRAIFREQVQGGFVLKPRWISTTDNVEADHLSRRREDEFLGAVYKSGFWDSGVLPRRHPLSGAIRQLGEGYSSNTLRDGPTGKGKFTQPFSVPYPRSLPYHGMPEHHAARMDEIMDSRLRPSSKDASNKALKYWDLVRIEEGWDRIVATDDAMRACKMCVFVMYLVDRTKLAYETIRNYVWGIEAWHVAQRQAKPTYGVLNWSEFMNAVEVLTFVTAEPRRAVPIEILEQALLDVDMNSFHEVQMAFAVCLLLFDFNRSENPFATARTGPKGFDEAKHWQVKDVSFVPLVRGARSIMALRTRQKALKQDPRVSRPEARGNEDFTYVGDAPESIFSIVHWYRALMSFHRGTRAPEAPFFVTAAGGDIHMLYGQALEIFRRLLGRACEEPELYGFHGLRVEGYNLSKKANGEDVTVAHGGWKSGSHKRYDRFDVIDDVLPMAARSVGAAVPGAAVLTPREVAPGATVRRSAEVADELPAISANVAVAVPVASNGEPSGLRLLVPTSSPPRSSAASTPSHASPASHRSRSASPTRPRGARLRVAPERFGGSSH